MISGELKSEMINPCINKNPNPIDEPSVNVDLFPPLYLHNNEKAKIDIRSIIVPSGKLIGNGGLGIMRSLFCGGDRKNSKSVRGIIQNKSCESRRNDFTPLLYKKTLDAAKTSSKIKLLSAIKPDKIDDRDTNLKTAYGISNMPKKIFRYRSFLLKSSSRISINPMATE